MSRRRRTRPSPAKAPTNAAELRTAIGDTRSQHAETLALKDLRAIRAATEVELEVFVHGALCVSYSGQCFSSEAWGGRSANRGQCAQACRLPYELEVDGAVRPLGDKRYLLSPGDLYAWTNSLLLQQTVATDGVGRLHVPEVRAGEVRTRDRLQSLGAALRS